MTNRRTANKTSKRRRQSPRDADVDLPEVDLPRKRAWGQMALAGAKMVLGAALVVGISGALAFALYRYAMTTPRFAVTEIAVEGTKRLVRDEVLAQAGLEEGQNIFSLDIEGREAALLQSPWIRRARVTRRLPGSVRVEVVERQPVALATIAGKTMLVSQDAEPFKQLGLGDPHDLPVITGISAEALARDRRAELERLESGLGILRDYEELPLSRALPAEELHLAPSGEAVLLIGREGTSLHLGQAPWKSKLLRAAKVMAKARRSDAKPGVVFLDNVAHPERVVVRMQ